MKKMLKGKKLIVTDLERGTVICDDARVADTFMTRLVGLLGRKGLATGEGLLIEPSSGVHTLGMSFPIDVVCLDQNRRVVKILENTAPWAICGVSLKTKSILELPAGRAEACRLASGAQLSFEVC